MKLRGQAGYAMAALLVAMSIMMIMMTVAMPVWKQASQREKEEELVFRGEQYARAIGLFKRKFANANPPNINVLVEQRFLRKKFKDPITNDDFVPLSVNQPLPGTSQPGATAPGTSQPGAVAGRGGAASPSGFQLPGPSAGASPSGLTGSNPGPGGVSGGIIGVTSKSKATSIRLYKGRNHYNEWAFVYTQQTQAPGVGGPGGAAPGTVPGQRGQQPQRGAPNSPFTSPFGSPGRGVQPPPGGGRRGGPGSGPIFPPPPGRGRGE
jgi:type II secretory pathway pseudopilin PulG